MRERRIGWRKVALGNALVALKDGTHGSFRRTSAGVPFLSAKNIGQNGYVQFDDDDDRISVRDYRSIYSTFTLAPRDVLLTIVGTLGRRAVYRGEQVAFQRSVAYLRANGYDLDPRFLYQVIGGAQFQQALISRSNATAQAGVYLGEVAKIAVLLPSLREQRRIVEILDTLDDQIRATEQIVAKQRLSQEGLLQRLFDVDDDSDLVPTPVGRLADTYAGGTPSRAVRGFYGGGIPWVKSGEVNRTFIDFTEETISPAALQGSPVRWVPAEVPLVAMYGATAGAVSWTQIRVTTNQAVLAVVPRSKDVRARWLYWALICASPRILATVQGSGQPNLSKTIIDRFPIRAPRVQEQIRVAAVLDATQAQLKVESELLSKLLKQKTGLMSDLLTGRVRMPLEAAS